MSLEQADTDDPLEWTSTQELDWNAIYAEQLPRIYNYFRFRLDVNADIEDLTARTFEKAWRSRSRYRRDLAGFSTWLFQIAHNVGVDYRRTQRTHLPLESALEAPCDASPERDIELTSDLERLSRLTASLPERERELIALKYGAALSNRLIARLTGLTESNVGTILHRTVEALRSQW